MKTILQIDSSAKTSDSATRTLTADIVATLKQQHTDSKVIYRDLTANPLPHISPEFLAGIFAGGEFAAHESVKRSDALVEELMSADIIVVGAPMYNFSIPSQLKAWIDHILRAGKTFQYTESGPKGLVSGKRAIIAIASGGVYSEGPMMPFDHVSTLLTQIFTFIGISDITVVRAESQAFGPEVAQNALNKAKATFEAEAKSFA